MAPIKKTKIVDLGLVKYQEAYDIQKEYVAQVQSGGDDVLIFCEHPTVLTMGRMAHEEHIFCKDEVDIVYIDRGGDITLHAPGQLVIYPILNLKHHGQDLKLYLRKLEGITIDALKEFGVEGRREEDKTGVWVKDKKIVSMGIGVKKWVSFHGVGLNVNTDLNLFRMIKPCGLDVEMTSLSNIIGGIINIQTVKDAWVQHFLQCFDLSKGE